MTKKNVLPINVSLINKLKSIFCLILSIFFISTCNQIKNEQSKSLNEIEQPKIKIIEKKVLLSIDQKSWNLSDLPESFQLAMVNNTVDSIITGEGIMIEIFENDSWMDISPEGIAYDDIGYPIPAGDTMVFEENIFQDKIDYQPGVYRIGKEYLKPDYPITKKEFCVFSEFLIE